MSRSKKYEDNVSGVIQEHFSRRNFLMDWFLPVLGGGLAGLILGAIAFGDNPIVKWEFASMAGKGATALAGILVVLYVKQVLSWRVLLALRDPVYEKLVESIASTDRLMRDTVAEVQARADIHETNNNTLRYAHAEIHEIMEGQRRELALAEREVSVLENKLAQIEESHEEAIRDLQVELEEEHRRMESKDEMLEQLREQVRRSELGGRSELKELPLEFLLSTPAKAERTWAEKAERAIRAFGIFERRISEMEMRFDEKMSELEPQKWAEVRAELTREAAILGYGRELLEEEIGDQL